MFAIDFRLGAHLIYEGKENWGDGTSIGAGDIMITILVVFIAFNNMGTLIPSFALIPRGKNPIRQEAHRGESLYGKLPFTPYIR
jgi:hypothetical protein